MIQLIIAVILSRSSLIGIIVIVGMLRVRERGITMIFGLGVRLTISIVVVAELVEPPALPIELENKVTVRNCESFAILEFGVDLESLGLMPTLHQR